MSVTVSNCNMICGSPLNKSSSKNLWTFAKKSRFEKLENPTYCSQSSYDLPSVQDKRKAGIGYGLKFDLTKQNSQGPAPDQYNIKGDVDINKFKGRGFQFGVSRDKMYANLNKQTPGPGKYELGSTLSTMQYSMRPRTQGDIMILNKFVPGPGTYQDKPSINSTGKYHLSKFSNSCATLFNPPRSKRFFENKDPLQVPGPGTHTVENTGIQKDGKYPLSKFPSSKCRSFAHDMRRTGSVANFEKTPGPGSYRIPSDFGYYESKNKMKSISQERAGTAK